MDGSGLMSAQPPVAAALPVAQMAPVQGSAANLPVAQSVAQAITEKQVLQQMAA